MWLFGNGLDEELLKFVFNPRRSAVAEDFVTARRAHDACEASLDDSAIEEPPEATLDVRGNP